jgi:two-component system response regulator YesN
MRKVMIVDDESLVRIGLQSIIPWESNGYQITGVFKNGEEALEAARQQPFDIVLTDIRMPGMNGLELIRELKKIDSEMKFIILSSYSDFEYTRQAIQLGVKDYMSKYEMEPDELFQVLNALTFNEPQPQRRGDIEAAPSQNEELNAEKQRILELDYSKNPVVTEESFPLLAQLKLASGGAQLRWITLMPIARLDGYSASERKAMLLLAEEMFARLRNPILLGESGLGLHGARWERADETEQQALAACSRMAAEWIASFAHNLNIPLTVAFGRPAHHPNDWLVSRREAEQTATMSFYRDDDIYFAQEMPESSVFQEEEWLELHKKIRHRIQFLQFEPMADELSELLKMEGERRPPSEWIRLFRIAASQLADELIERFHLDAEEIRVRFGEIWPLPEAIAQAKSQHELISLLHQMTTLASAAINRWQVNRNWVSRVKEYVEEHYASTIHLEDAAAFVNFSVSHFSQRFRQETGEAFTDYLTRIRIREATRLYLETELSTEEIAARVGYTNANYFIKVFKRTTGQTVKAFKKDR